MRNLGKACLFAAILLVASAAVAQEAWEIDPAHSTVGFSVRHMMVSNVHGEFAKFSGKIYVDGKDFTKARVEVTIDASSISTHNDGRDKDLRSTNFFDAEKFPTLEFKSKRVEQASQGDLHLIGDQTMHGFTAVNQIPEDGEFVVFSFLALQVASPSSPNTAVPFIV